MMTAPGYESVRDVFLAGAGSLGRGGGAYCAYVGGVPVVDLWAGQKGGGRPWESETTTVLMSATKGFATLCLQLLVDRGHVDVDAPVAQYWPEFAQNGKEGVLVRHVLLHTAGVIGFEGMHEVVRLDGTGWDDYEGISAGLAAAPLLHPAGAKHYYHALTVGWLIAEIVRRVDGRTLGRLFDEEFARPLGLEAWVGTPTTELARVAQVHDVRLDHLPGVLRRYQLACLAAARDPKTPAGLAFLGDGTRSGVDQVELLFNSASVLSAEFPAGGATATARAMARLWAAMAGGGELDGTRILSQACVDTFGEVRSREPDLLLAQVPASRVLSSMVSAPVPRTLGYLGNQPVPGIGHKFGPNPLSYGVEGLGGQYGFCDPQANIAVGFVRSELAAIDVLQATVTNELYACALRLGHDVIAPPPRSATQRLAQRALGSFVRRRIAVPALH